MYGQAADIDAQQTTRPAQGTVPAMPARHRGFDDLAHTAGIAPLLARPAAQATRWVCSPCSWVGVKGGAGMMELCGPRSSKAPYWAAPN